MGILFYFNQIYARRLIDAIEHKDVAKVERIAKQRGDVNSKPYLISFFPNIVEIYNQPPIFTACRSGNPEILKILIDSGAKTNAFCDKTYPLQETLRYPLSEERTDMFNLLMDSGINIQKIREKHPTYLFYVFCVGKGPGTGNYAENEAREYDMFLRLIEKDVPPNENVEYYEGNFLHQTAKWDNLLITKYLVEQLNYDINSLGSENQTALIKSTINNSTDMLEYLLSCSADKTFKDINGKTALDYAIEKNHTQMITLLS